MCLLYRPSCPSQPMSAGGVAIAAKKSLVKYARQGDGSLMVSRGLLTMSQIRLP